MKDERRLAMIATCNYINDYDNVLIGTGLYDDFFSDDICTEVMEFPVVNYSEIENKMDSDEECVSVPRTNIYENDNEYIVRAEMPGVANNGVEVTLNNNELEIKGKVIGNVPESNKLKYSEFDLYDYHRKLVVDSTIDENGLSANLENGLLTVKLPKKEGAKPKRIEVKTVQ
jgi:HSP20 family protein